MQRLTATAVLVAALLLSFAAPAFAQNPCDPTTTPPSTGQLRMLVTFTDFDAVTGTVPKMTGAKMASFAVGVDPNTGTPIQGPTPLQKSDFTLVPGTPNCYQSGPTINGLLASVPVSLTQQYITAVKETGPGGESETWAVSLPFLNPPPPPAVPGGVRVIR